MSLQNELARLLDDHRWVRTTNTPSDVLATVMLAALKVFEDGILARAEHAFYRPGRDAACRVPTPIVRHSAVDGIDGPVNNGRCVACENDD
jgi:hypothetical protein